MTTYVGKSIGKIRIIESLGSGGSGDVYVGFDEKLKRNVAVKALRGEKRFDVNARARLAREAEILSQLDHPNICRIYDYLEQDDCDFLVLELVRGQNLLEIDRKEVNQAANIKISRQIAMALSAAHEQNVIHRDLKPQNVMINEDGNVKVLDFGLAHSTLVEPIAAESQVSSHISSQIDNDEAQDTSFSSGQSSFRTECGRVTGTPMYMSPEQARSEPMTAASDMYSFGLLMQWIFTGAHPHSTKLPPQRLIWLAVNGESLPVKGVQTDLTGLINRLKSVAPELRPTAVEAADRLEWIQAAPKRKRRRFELVAVGLVLLLATFVSIVDSLRARRAEKRAIGLKKAAVEAQSETKAVNAFLANMLASADPENEGIHVKVVDVLDRAARDVEKTLAGQPKTKAAVLHTLGTTYLGIGAGEKALIHLRTSCDIKRQEFGENHVDTLSTKTQIGNTLIALGKYQDAEKILEDTLRRYESVFPKSRRDVLSAQVILAKAFQFQGEYPKSEDLYRETWHVAHDALGEDHKMTLEALTGLAWSLQHQGKHGEAEEIHRQALAAQTQHLGAEHPDTLASMYGLAGALQYQKKLDQAESILRKTVTSSIRIFGADHSNTLSATDSLATVLADQNKFLEAEQLLRDALQKAKMAFGNDHPEVLGFINNLAWLLTHQKKCDQAEALLGELVTRSRKTFGEKHPYTLAARGNLAKALVCLKRLDEGEALYLEILGIVTEVVGEAHYLTFKTTFGLAKTLEEKGKPEEAIRYYRQAASNGHEESQAALKRLDLVGDP